ncbi:HD domain-containing phosphohydrolase [uncultured Desulfuromonas sp.]|uniref:HD domain-containing phosphohydrolase n=1 Tax=uncultured Desulfuromonas sp. TaxID=181013 RepID=UPI002AABA721|nr:HD domain-containing phosphohydrolase [uncultured Desulfuromonas sp.]
MVTTPFLSPPPQTRLLISRRRALLLAIVVITVIAIGTIIGSSWSIRDKEREMERSLEQRLSLLAISHAQVIDTWLEGLIRQGDRIVNSDLFRLYATEVDLIEEDISALITPEQTPTGDDEAAALRAQLPELQNIFIEFSHYAGFLSGRLVHPNGQAYLSTDSGISHLSEQQKALAQQVLNSATAQFSALQATSAGLVIDMALPLFSLDSDEEQNTVVAVLILTKVVTEKINQLLSASPLIEQGERVHLLQDTAKGLAVVTPWMPKQIAPLTGLSPQIIDNELPFAVRPGLQSGKNVYSLAIPLPRLPWWIVEEMEYTAARASLSRHARTAWSISALLMGVFSLGFGILWFQQIGLKNRETARHFKSLAEQIDKQRQLLNNINDNIDDFICLKDIRGLYQYANPAMVKALGRELTEILDRDDCAVFGFDTAKRLEKLDRQVAAEAKPISVQETLYLQSQPTHVLISKAPLFEKSDQLGGIITVMSDITELVESQKRHERAIRRTVEALVSAIELNDTYLAGHSQRLRQLSKEVMKQLGGNKQQVATVEMAANLSQIGKMFIDKNLIAAQRPLSDEERHEVEQHVEHSARILRPIPFELPVPETIYQINEHLDGSGYPKGLQGNEILFTARVLSVTNSFCAMVEPRAHRTGKSIADALDELENLPQRYEASIVTALRNVIESPAGDKILRRQEDA